MLLIKQHVILYKEISILLGQYAYTKKQNSYKTIHNNYM